MTTWAAVSLDRIWRVRPQRRRSGLLRRVAPLLLVLAMLAAWQLWVSVADVAPYLVPAPSRIVAAFLDSRHLLLGHLLTTTAEALLGMGDMLYKPVSAMRPSRVQGAFISESEVGEVVVASAASASGDARPDFVEEVTQPKEDPKKSEEPDDDLLPDAASFVVSTQQASVSAVQRRFRVGYSRAGRIIDALERRGVVGPYEGSKSRSVVASELDLPRIFEGEGEDGDTVSDPFGIGPEESW